MRLPIWTAGILALLVLGYALPYTLLSGVERWHGAFLFWILFGAAVWLLLVFGVSRWRVDQSPD